MNKLVFLFLLYKPQGIIKALWTILRIIILPYNKLDSLVPKNGTILDIGCGNGGLSNYLSLQSPKRKILGIDLSKKRIESAKKSIGKRKNVNFALGDVIKIKKSKADCYLIVDVLHHIDFEKQERLLRFLAKKMNKNSRLIIKEVDPSNKIPFLCGHVIEKALYPKEKIYARPKKEWEKVFRSLGLAIKVTGGTFYFPDSTCIFVLTKI